MTQLLGCEMHLMLACEWQLPGGLPNGLRCEACTPAQVVEGDVSAPGCGLSEADAALISARVDHVIHCAASISFFEHIHALLDQNYWVRPASLPVQGLAPM